MTYNRGINSKYKAKDFLKRGLKSMFPAYDEHADQKDGQAETKSATTPTKER